MFTYFKVTWKSGDQTLFPLAFWKATELEDSINPDHVASGEIITLDEATKA